ncbi:4-coumarate--CoA ligase-like 7 [Madurella mycetomatis]|uniref:4-coumarate--CoA ligase-like 7 n=1 Tax=Madurella mycetomatis TaxID=100816 RepID=A0A175VYJ0_9PEZI|nr:4-coumarate--CoA ligase-like 7 [Madurella mycetomatis]KXX83177.1 4-coumarate--CoA ligase-like 7 [Madurella mycetomatis]
MAFYRTSWAPSLSDADIPDDISLSDFLFDDKLRPRKCEDSGQPFIDSVSGSGYGIPDIRRRIEWLAAGLASKLGIHDTSGDAWQRVVGLFAVNNPQIHNPVLAWAVHRLNGVITPANVAFRASELAHQLKDSGARGLLVSPSRLDTALEAAKLAGILESNIFLIPVPGDTVAQGTNPKSFLDVEDLVTVGRQLPPLPHTKWSKGQGRRQAAYLCYSSGTSGPPKGVMISHRNIIANVIQMTLYESTFLSRSHPDVILGVLPQSHIYSIILTTHVPVFRGDTVVTMAKFELMSFVHAINRFRMTLLYVVPPILISLIKQGGLAQDPTTFDLPSVKRMYCGAAPLSEELSSQIRKRYPSVLLGQGYGMTESATVISSHPKDVYDGSSGCIIPGIEIKIVGKDGNEVREPNKRGELFVKGPNVTLGYYKNENATRETFANGWLRTGDEVEIRLHPQTKDAHLFVVDRVKELIKVSGFQVAPAELEGHLLAHPMVADCAVIPVPDDKFGEVPKALVVLRKDSNVDHQAAEQQLKDWIAQHKSKHKHLRGGVEFLPEVPKSPSGKILRRLLRDRERASLSKRKMMAKL